MCIIQKRNKETKLVQIYEENEMTCKSEHN